MKRGLAKLACSNAVVVLALFALAPSDAGAGTFSFSGASSGTTANVPIDLDGTNCGPVNGVLTCPADSGLGTGGGSMRGFPGSGPGTFQIVIEDVPVPGTGCSLAPSTQQGCTVGSAIDGCLYSYVPGGSGVTRTTATGDLLIYSYTSGTVCVNFDTPLPWSLEGQAAAVITGGTGGMANATGSFTGPFHGQILQSDPAGHGLGWFTASIKGTITLP